MGTGKWTYKSAERIAKLLAEQLQVKVSANTVRRLLLDMDYSLKSNRKCLSSGSAANRDAQFRQISALRAAFTEAGQPIISVDTKKKELIGNFKNAGQIWSREAQPVNDHDFRSQAKGLAVPYGIYDLLRNAGLLVAGQSADTPEFAVTCIQSWWRHYGEQHYPQAGQLLILADSGGSNGASPRAWKKHLQEKLADEFGLEVRVAHYPSGASKWNPIEHRMFSEISKNWRGEPLLEFETVVNFARGTTTARGLHIDAELDQCSYERGEKIGDAQMQTLHLRKDEELPRLNYVISPRTEPRLERLTASNVIPVSNPRQKMPSKETDLEAVKM